MPRFGPEGYPDWQKVRNWDNPPFLSFPLTEFTGIHNTETFNVRNSQCLAGRLGLNKNPVNIQLNWYTDSAKTVFLSERNLVMHSTIESDLQLCIPHMGPFLQIQVRPRTEATKYDLAARLFATDRIGQSGIIPVSSKLVFFSEEIAGKAKVAVFPETYFAGQGAVLFTAGGGTGRIALNANVGMENEYVAHEAEVASAVPTTFAWTMPATAFSFTVENTAVAPARMTLAVTPQILGYT